MRVAVDNAGDDELPCGVNHLSVFRGIDGLADLGDFAILNQDGAVLDRSMRDGEDGGISNHSDGGRVRRRGSVRRNWDVNEAKNADEVEERSTQTVCVQ